MWHTWFTFGFETSISIKHCKNRKLFLFLVNKLIIDTRTKFSIYARRAFRLQKTHQWRSNPKNLKRPNKVRCWRALSKFYILGSFLGIIDRACSWRHTAYTRICLSCSSMWWTRNPTRNSIQVALHVFHSSSVGVDCSCNSRYQHVYH